MSTDWAALLLAARNEIAALRADLERVTRERDMERLLAVETRTRLQGAYDRLWARLAEAEKLLAFSYVSPAHDNEGKPLDDYVIVRKSAIDAIESFLANRMEDT